MPRIAVVDNDLELTRLIGEVFQWEGWDLLPVRAESAFDRLSSAHPDLILLEPWLRQPDAGWTIIESLRTDPGTRSIPIIVWSSAMDRLRPRASWLSEQGIPIVAKPFEIAEVLGLVRALLPSAVG